MNPDEMQAEYDRIRGILERVKTVANFGVSSNHLKDSYWIVHYLHFQDFTIFPINPGATEIHGRKAYADLESLPEVPDVVQVFRRPEDVPPVVDSAIAIGAKVVWMQEGVINEAARQTALDAGLEVVMNVCMRAAHQFLIGDEKGWGRAMSDNQEYREFASQF